MRITPINEAWVYNHVLRPYLHGAAMVNLAWKHMFSNNPNPENNFRWHKIAVYLIVGCALSVPFINNIVWVAWNRFGHPTRLTNPYSPERAVTQQNDPLQR